MTAIKPAPLSVTQYAVPEHLRESDPNLVLFVKYYNEWMQRSGNALDILQNIVEYRDPIETTDQYLTLITQQLLSFIPNASTVNRRLLVTKMKDFYKAKGTLPSYQFVLNVLFGTTADITWNTTKVFRPSSNSAVRDGYTSVESATPWDNRVLGATLVQTYPTTATAVIETIETSIVNGKIINELDLIPDSIVGEFTVGSDVKLLDNRVDRTFIYVQDYYTFISSTANTLTVAIPIEPSRSYPNLIVRQLGSTFQATVSSLVSRTIQNNNVVLTFNLSGVTGTIGTDEVFLLPSTVGTHFYTKADFLTGTISPTISGFEVTNGGSLYEIGESVTYVGGDGNPFEARVDGIGGGAIETINIVDGGYGYSVGDVLQVTSDGAGAGLNAVVKTIDGFDARLDIDFTLDGFQIANGGKKYAVGDTFTIEGGRIITGATPTIFTVSSINNTLALNSIDMVQSGYDYIYAKLALHNNDTNALVAGFDATANIVNGTIQGVTINTAPAITTANLTLMFNGGLANIGATVTAGAISAINIVSGGFNFTNPVIQIVSAQVPTRAAHFSYTLNASGTITGITIIDGGAGYSATVTVVVTEKWGAGASANVIVNNTTGPVTGLTITHGGTYTVLPQCFDAPYYAKSANGTGLVLNLKYKVAAVGLYNCGQDYKIPALDMRDGVGNGAVLQPVIVDGAINTIGVTNGGSGYTHATVEIVGTGVGFSGAVSIVAGAITGVVIYDAGYGYSLTDTIVVHGDGVNAVLSFTIKNGAIREFVVLDGGKNYAYDTTLTYQLDPVANPTAVAGSFTPVIANGVIKSVTVVSSGSGYITLTNDLKNEDNTYLLFEDGVRMAFISPYDVPVLHAGAPTIITIDKAPTGGVITTAVVADGSGYKDPSELTPLESYVVSTTGKGAVVIPVLENGKIVHFNILNAGNLYSLTDTMTIIGGGGTGATASPVIVNGELVDVIITNPGSGYQYGTNCLVLGNGYGAELQAGVSTAISKVEIVNGGSGYVASDITLVVNDAVGTGAILRPVLNANGTIVDVIIVADGSGYVAPTISITHTFGAGASLTPIVTRGLHEVVVVKQGSGYTFAEVLVVGDGVGAKVTVDLENNGSISNAQLSYAGTGYTGQPVIPILDISNYGAVTQVDIINGGALYEKPPIVSLADKYSGVNLIASGAKFSAWGSNVGRVLGVSFYKFGAGWTEQPKIVLPTNYIMEKNSNFIFGENVEIERYPYKPVDTMFNILCEDGVFLWGDFKYGFLRTEDFFVLTTEAGEALDEEDVGDIEQEFYEIINAQGVPVPYHDAGPSGQVSALDFSRNILELSAVTDQFTFITEDGNSLISEREMFLADEASNGIYIGDVIVGRSSGAEATIKWFNRATGILQQKGMGLTPKSMTDDVGVLNNPNSMLHDSNRIQDYAYVIRTQESLASYENVLLNTVHPAGYRMFGDYIVSAFSFAHTITTPPSFGIKGGGSSFSTTLSLKDSFANLHVMQNKGLMFYDRTKQYWYTTPSSIFSGFTFENYDYTSINYISSIEPLVGFEPYVSKTYTMTATATLGSTSFTGITSTAGINIGYRVIGYDSLGNNIFGLNHFLTEDGLSHLLTEDLFVMARDEGIVDTEIVGASTLTASHPSTVTGTVTLVVQNIPSLRLA